MAESANLPAESPDDRQQLQAIRADILALRDRIAADQRRNTIWGVAHIVLTALVLPVVAVYIQYVQTQVQREAAAQQQAFAEVQTLQLVIPYVIGDKVTGATRRAAVEIVKPMENPALLYRLALILSDEGDYKHAFKAVESAMQMAKTQSKDFDPAVQNVYATVIANHTDTELDELLANFLAKRITQVRAISEFDTRMARMLKLCGDSRLGQAGTNCISERVSGGGDNDFYKRYRDKMSTPVRRAGSLR